MRHLLLLLIIPLLMPGLASAKVASKKKAGRKPSQVEASAPIGFKVVYGEKTTLFLISKSRAGGRVEFSNNLGARSSKDISSDDYDYLNSKVQKLSGPTNRKEFCLRNYVELTADGKRLLGCLGAPNKLAKDMQETVNLLSVLF